MTRRQLRGEAGSATVLVLALTAVVMCVAGAAVAVGQLAIARQRAGTAADLAVLAGAAETLWGPEGACARAADVAGADGARLEDCRLQGLDLVVRVSVPAPPLVARAASAAGHRAPRVSAVARAGPPDPGGVG